MTGIPTKHPNQLPPIGRAPPTPGIANWMASPYPYNYWHDLVRIDEERFLLINRWRTIATVGDPQTIAEALLHLPIPKQFLDRDYPRRPATTAADLGIDLDLDTLLKGL